MKSKLVFLHVSDIHLREDELTSGVELDHDLRSELLRDVRKLRGEAFTDLDGVLLTGDVAYGGKAIEFDSAREWLDELQAEFGYPEGNVWCVPGNHDVDREHINKSALCQKIRASVRSGGEAIAARGLHELLKDEGAHATLLDPLRRYNDRFANGFQCTTKCPTLCWSDRIPFAEKYEVVLHGLNSAVISDSLDDVGAGRLVLGTWQLNAIKRPPGAINIALCHHPPRWLFDHRAASDFMNSRTSLQLFGHEHNCRIEPIGRSVKVFAGALHPQREEPQWEPRFNIIVLAVDDPTVSTDLRIQIWPRAWDHAATEFRAAPTGDDKPHGTYMIPLPEPLLVENMAARSAPQARVNVQSGSESLVAVSTPTVVPSKEAVQMPRDIVYRFYQLSWMQRLRIAMELGLYSDEDADVDEAEMGRRVFLRASERDGLHDLGAAIDRDLAQTPT